MFTIYAGGVLIYDDTSMDPALKLTNPKLTLEQNSPGTFTATIPPGNAGYNTINRTTSLIQIYKEGTTDPYWEGRILGEDSDFWNNRKVTCEGVLSFLNDTIQPPAHYQEITAESFLDNLLTVHNSQVDESKRLYKGTVSNIDLSSHHRYTNYETTMECISDKLLERSGGYLSIRHDNGKRYIDYNSTYHEENTQKIEFGKNLLDFTKTYSSDDFCTVLVPRGAKLDEGPYEALETYTTVESVNGGSIYVHLTDDDFDEAPETLPIDEYGWIAKVHDWEDVYLPSNLLSRAKAYLKEQQFDKMVLEVTAVDLNYAGGQYQEINLYDSVRVRSTPHGLDRLFPVTKMEISLDKPEETKFTLGTEGNVSLTSASYSSTTSIMNQIANLPTEQSLTSKFKAEAATMIESATTGYFTIIQNEETGATEVVFSQYPDYLHPESQNIWRWTNNGLAFSPTGYNSGNYSVALTADGRINADLISTGTLIADLIKAGTIQSYVENEPVGSRFSINLTTGEVHIKAYSDAIAALESPEVGGRNLIINTFYPSMATSDDLPRLLEQGLSTTVATGLSNVSLLSHGFRSYKGESTSKPVITFGATNKNTSGWGLQGLIPGETYTFSAIAQWKVKSNFRLRLTFANWDSDGNIVESTEYQTTYIEDITAGVEDSRKVSLTFTVPEGSTGAVIQFSQREAAATDYDTTDYIGLNDIKLERGTIATDWTPAPEDIAGHDEYVQNEVLLQAGSLIDTSAKQVKTEVYNDYITDINNQLTSLGRDYTSVAQTANNLKINVGKLQDDLNAKFIFDTDGLKISGTSDSNGHADENSYLQLKASEVALYQDKVKRLWLTSEGANADVFNATNGFAAGTGSNKFIWEAYSNGFRLRKA